MASSATSSIAATLAANIRTARLAADLTQAQLAARLGIEGMNVSKWERAVHAPSLPRLLALGEILGRDVAWFYTDHDTGGVP